MSLEKITRVAQNFIFSRKNEVLLLRGRWGIGKTFFWQHLVQEEARRKNLGYEHYSYVSLFGVSDLEALKTAIFVAREKESRAAKQQRGSIKMQDLAIDLEKHPMVRQWTGQLGVSLAFAIAVKDTLICFDDLERKGDKLEFQEIFGLISVLKEQRNCKIAVIANEDTLAGVAKEQFQRYSEKIVDYNLEFIQTPDSAFSCAFDSKNSHTSILRESCLKLGIVNIRILQRLKGFFIELAPQLQGSEEDVARSILSSLALFTWCFYDKADTTPPLEHIRNLTVDRYVEIELEKASPEKSWNSFLADYGYNLTDELDTILIDFVEHGYLDAEELKEKLADKNFTSQRETSRKYHRETWALYYDSLDNNEVEFIEALTRGFRSNITHLTLIDLGQTSLILRELEQGKLADQLIDEYIDLHKADLLKMKSTPQISLSARR